MHIPVTSTASSSQDNISIILVDDSAVIRSALTRLLTSDPSIKIVASVADGSLGVDAARTHKPDVLLLDIEMPVMDGLTALPKIREASPNTKVVMFSSLTEKGADATLKAMALGAVECVAKPSSYSLKGQDDHFQETLIGLIQNLAAKPSRAISGTTAAPQAPSTTLNTDSMAYKGKPDILAIGSSTGGPQALFATLSHCKDIDVPIVITQHMPATFTKILAEHITQQTGIPASEGEEGMTLEKGRAYVAPGGKHMLFKSGAMGTTITLDDGEPVNFCKPAVDCMLDSLIDIYGNKILCTILTGMGHDGLAGAKKLTECHGRVIAQDEKTSIVWGMPGAVAEAGICSAVLPLNDIGPWLKKAIMG